MADTAAVTPVPVVASRRAFSIRRVALLLAISLLAASVFFLWVVISMPGASYRGDLPPLSDRQAALRAEFRRDLQVLAGDIGQRGVHNPDGLRRSEEFLSSELAKSGYEVRRHPYKVHGVECTNLDVERRGVSRAGEIVVVGAHYDAVYGTVGANDNGSGVVATLALARRFAKKEVARTLRFAFFVNEEPPYFQTPMMGSYVYAKASHERGEQIVGMISIETIGHYDDRPGSQKYPAFFGLLYPSQGNYIAFVSRFDSREFLHSCIRDFRRHAQFPSEGIAAPEVLPQAGFSDQWAFWRFGYPALMVTDTAMLRYPYYHSDRDTPEKLDYDRMARVVDGIASVIEGASGRSN